MACVGQVLLVKEEDSSVLGSGIFSNGERDGYFFKRTLNYNTGLLGDVSLISP